MGTSTGRIAPHAGMVIVQLISATYVVVSRVILIEGISSTVFLVYQFALATIITGSMAFIFERDRPPLSISILGWIFILALTGVTLSQNLLSASLYYISSALESSVINMVPVFIYILSIISRQEKLEINTLWGKGKLCGTLVSVSGAFTLMLWKESAVDLVSTTGWGEWALGLAMVVVGVVAFSAWIMLLRPVTRRYPAETSMTAIMLFFAMLQTTVVAAISSHKASQWRLKWDLELVNILYGAVFYSGLSNLITMWCASKKGPVFVASFAPLSLVFTSILEIILLGEALHIGSIVGSIMIIGGLYIYLWSKSKEEMHHLMEGDDAFTSSLI
ncbi:auxin-induced protein 5NG4-like isoform X2 [Magnolia sinica]|uniref:auxin-induced protein 5NG4-like isoform X2 n=1 Tax=Magnolia sinica TaxID=86752 RepID=UPI00265B34D3|nr:auxin-induced protein 5NG4-like isoform X2 [Magnolia sinica]